MLSKRVKTRIRRNKIRRMRLHPLDVEFTMCDLSSVMQPPISAGLPKFFLYSERGPSA